MSPDRARPLLAIAALLSLGCSSGSSSGSHADDPLALPSGPPLACEAGDYDIGAQSSAGLSLVALDGIGLSEPTSVLGQAAYQSAPFSLCIPDDAVSLSLYGGGGDDVLPNSWVGSGIGELVDTSSVQTWVRSVTPELSLPKSDGVPLVPGRHTFRLVATAPANPPVRLAIRRGARGDHSTFHLNLVLVDGCGIDSGDADAFASAATRFDDLYGQVGIAVSALGAGTIADTSLAVLDDSNLQALVNAPVTPSADYPPFDDGVTLYLVRELLSNDAAGTLGQLAGKAMGIPGVPFLTDKRGVVLAVDAHRVGSKLSYTALWTTAAHEVGHWHGLRHTTERWGSPHDYVADTPQCPAWHDTNHDGYVEPWECPAAGSNLMFWYYDITNPPTKLTAGQGFVLHSGLTMTPG
jgi:hypothetical protein